MWLIKTVTTLTKTALFLTGEEGWGPPFPWQGNSHDYPKLHVLCGTLRPHWLQWSRFLTANGLTLFMLLLPQISPSEPTTAAGTQPCHHPHYLSSFHDFYCPPCLCSQAQCPIAESRFAFSGHRTLPGAILKGLHSICSADTGCYITSLQKRSSLYCSCGPHRARERSLGKTAETSLWR